MLNGGRQLAITVAAARMRADGVLEPGEGRHTLRVCGSIGRHADALDRETFDAVSERGGVSIGELRRRVAAGPAIASIETRLVDDGVLLDVRARTVARRLWLVVVPLLALGSARLVAGLENHKPIGDLTVILCVEVVGIGSLWFQRPYATQAGRRLLDRQRARQAGWRVNPSRVPAALAVALFGTGALWMIDPTFAAACAVPREKAGVSLGNYTGRVGGGCGGGGGGCGGGGGGCGG
jgi:uncharacterized protein (TIGR04222 family)